MEDARQYFEFIREKLRTGNSGDALSWLQADPRRGIWEYGNEESIAIVNRLTILGATGITAVGVEDDNCCELIVQLPVDDLGRSMIFTWSREQAERCGFDPDEDFGQEHLYVYFT